MIPSFKTLATLAAVLCLLLALIWACLPASLLQIWGIEYAAAAGVLARRCAALFAGVGVMFALARQAPRSQATVGLLAGLAAGCLLLAVLGTAEYLLGHAGAGILLTAVSELLLALWFGAAAYRDSRQLGAA